MAYAGDLKSPDAYASCGFDPHPGHSIHNTYRLARFWRFFGNDTFVVPWLFFIDVLTEASRCVAKVFP